MASAVVPANKPEFVIQRVFKAPRELVYRIWTQAEYVREWWGVEGATIVACDLDVRPGGTFRIDMRSADGTVYVNRGVYIEVTANERIVSRDQHEGSENTEHLPNGTHTVTFEEHNGGTLVTLISRFESTQIRDDMVRYGMVDGIEQSLDRLSRLIVKHHF